MSITTPAGFVAAGLASGIKASGALDLALVATDDGRPVPTAATFTRNLACAAPVQISRAHLAADGGRAAAVLVSSGNANAATGDRGRSDAATMCRLTAEGLGVAPEEVLVCSTGLIGIPLPMDVIERGIPTLVAARAGGDAAGADAAAGILTTDSGRKEALVAYPDFTVAGMAKGAGMLAPDMATMLAFLTTDAAVEPGPLADILRAAVDDSFNSMTVDGCTSTNDTVVLMASGRAGPGDPTLVADAVTEVCADLARQMAADAEGAERIFQVQVTGARSDGDPISHQTAATAPKNEDRRWADYSYAHGGKDGTPFPVDRATYDQNIAILIDAVRKARVGENEKMQALRRLSGRDSAS